MYEFRRITQFQRDAKHGFPLIGMMDSITQTLCKKAKSGDREAYDRLFALHSDRALMFVRARLGPQLREIVESIDVLQDAYLAAHEAFDKLLLLRFFEGLSAEEAGQVMDRTAGAVRKLTSRALVELGKRL